MSELKPPQDLELKNIIDKLANFVARNGLEFENMTKQKQQGNPKFSFLFSGEHNAYYRFKVVSEAAGFQNSENSETAPVPSQHSSLGKKPSLEQLGNTAAPSFNVQVEKLNGLIVSLQEQITQSENNLSAQFQTIMQQQQKIVEECLIGAKMKNLQEKASGLNLSIADLGNVLDPVINTCTKDSISTAKSYVLEHLSSPQHGEVMMQYILERLLEKNNLFEHRLHLIYLINDLVHHCSRKGVPELVEVIERLVVSPAFAFTFINAAEDGKKKMNKLLTLWENNKYFQTNTIESLKDSNIGLAAYQAKLISCFPEVVNDVSIETNKQLQLLQQQHQEFVNHINQQISVLQQQQQLSIPPSNNINNNDNTGDNVDCNANININTNSSNAPPSNSMPINPPLQPWNSSFNRSSQFINNTGVEEIWNTKAPEGPINFPDLTKPPPGFPPLPNPSKPPPHLDLLPNIPYYDLPAGLIVPLVKLEDCDYTPLNPADLRLPPPMPPTERLLAAVEAFYAPPSHERPRDGDGWEKLGLFEFFKAKNKAKSMRAFTERNNKANNNHNDDAISCKNINTTSLESNITKRTFVENKRVDKKSAPKRSRTPSPRRLSSSRSRSPTPQNDDDGIDPYYQVADKSSRLQDDNKGHQLMKKMGWGGGALGTSGVGILDPIDGGEVRDKVDQFKGLGMRADPFENYRKTMSSGFNVRMRERTDHRSSNRNN